MPPTPFVEVGAGPGTFTGHLPRLGAALDQSEAALRVLRSHLAGIPVVRGDVFRLPVRDRAVPRLFAAHIYGLLTEAKRGVFLTEGHRIAEDLVKLMQAVPLAFRRRIGNTEPLATVRPSMYSDATSMLKHWQPR